MSVGTPGQLYDANGVLQLLDGLYPRLLGQIDRDPDSPTYGSCDRHFWMYRLHDFDSGVLQQASLTLAALAVLAEVTAFPGCRFLRREYASYWRELAKAICRRTERLLRGSGTLDEYFPGERSLPATVFGGYATLKAATLLDDTEILESAGLEAVARRLLKRESSPAANQDVAAAAFLALYSRVRSWRSSDVDRALDRLLGGPRADGVFLEYGGADLGYGTVTLHFLSCLQEDRADRVVMPMKALGTFLSRFVTPSGRLGGEFPSRSTTYGLPYGLVEAARLDRSIADRFSRYALSEVFAKLDDRYLTHYCFPSLALTAVTLTRVGPPAWSVPPISGKWTCDWEPASGLLAARCGSSAVFAGPKKGGALHVEHSGTTWIDCGYRVDSAGETYATCVIDADRAPVVTTTATGVEIVVRAGFLRYNKLVASPLKTIVLRAISFFGPSFNRLFKRVLITDAKILPGITMERRIRLEYRTGILTIEDHLVGGAWLRVRRAPATSFRLVPSARFYQAGEEEANMEASCGLVTFPVRRTFALSPADPSGDPASPRAGLIFDARGRGQV
jgi:hypothetical protein